MKKLIVIIALVWAGMVVIPVIAQMPIPFQHWPALYDAVENLSVKRGVDRNGQQNDRLYFRVGWGPCLAVFTDEWGDLVEAAQFDRYINMRGYAEGQLGAQGEWGPDDDYNCPSAPLVVKPYRTGSRPLYYRELDEDRGVYVKGRKSPYRVRTDGDSVPCRRYGTAKLNGDLSNYWILGEAVEVYHDDITLLVGELQDNLVAVCEEQDISILDHRW